MSDQPRKRITIDAPDSTTVLAARHLDATEGRVQVGTTVDSATRAAISQVLRYIATAHNSPAATDLPASTTPATAAHPLVKGRCPACRGASLFLGSGGHVTCARLDCPGPCAADDLLHGEQPAPGTAATEATDPPDSITDPEWLRQQYAAAMYRLKCPYGVPWENTLSTDRPPFLQLADAVLAVRDRELERLADVETNMQFWIDQHKRARQSAFDQRQRAKTAEQQRDRLAALVRDFRDPDPCRLDHHGYCQAHSWMCSGNTCPHARARDILASIDDQEQP